MSLSYLDAGSGQDRPYELLCKTNVGDTNPSVAFTLSHWERGWDGLAGRRAIGFCVLAGLVGAGTVHVEPERRRYDASRNWGPNAGNDRRCVLHGRSPPRRIPRGDRPCTNAGA